MSRFDSRGRLYNGEYVYMPSDGDYVLDTVEGVPTNLQSIIDTYNPPASEFHPDIELPDGGGSGGSSVDDPTVRVTIGDLDGDGDKDVKVEVDKDSDGTIDATVVIEGGD